VRQHYYDFLSRLPDQEGLNYWVGQIAQCQGVPLCTNNRRIDVSNAFFFEQEYQQTGAYVFRLYRTAFGNNQPFPNPVPDPVNPGEEKKLVSYQAFAIDRARVVGGHEPGEFATGSGECIRPAPGVSGEIRRRFERAPPLWMRFSQHC